MSDIKVVNIGNIIGNTFPSNDGRVYLYKRDNGHLYTYINGVEKHICCDDGLINNVPIFIAFPSVEAPPVHIPDEGHFMLFVYDGLLYSYDNTLVPVLIGGFTPEGAVVIEGIAQW